MSGMKEICAGGVIYLERLDRIAGKKGGENDMI
jgi:hypothetical protein